MEKVTIPKKYGYYINDIYKQNNLINDSFKDYEVSKKIAEHYIDAEKFNASDELVYFLLYQSVRFAYNIKPINPKYIFKYIDEILSNEELKNEILQTDCKSEFYTIIKDIIPYYNEFNKLINEKKNYQVLKKYREILNILNLETLNLYPNEASQTKNEFTYTNIHRKQNRENRIKFTAQAVSPLQFFYMDL